MNKQEKEILRKYALWQNLFLYQDNSESKVSNGQGLAYCVSCSEGGCSNCSSCSPSPCNSYVNLTCNSCQQGCNGCKGCGE